MGRGYFDRSHKVGGSQGRHHLCLIPMACSSPLYSGPGLMSRLTGLHLLNAILVNNKTLFIYDLIIEERAVLGFIWFTLVQ